jgi:hypothetical protein
VRTSRRLLLLLCAAIFAPAHAADLDRDVARLTGKILGETPAMADLQELTDRIGGRLTGTPACERAVDWAVAKFRGAGVDAVATESFEMPSVWIPRSEEAACLSPATFPLRVAAAPGTAGTPGGKPLEAALVDAGDGGEAAWAALGKTASGAIALVRNPEMKTLDDLFAEYMTASALLAAARKAGAAAVLLESSRPRDLLYRHPMTFNADVDSMPVAIVAREQAERLLRLVATEPVRVRLAIDNEIRRKVASRNVVAEIRGSAAPEDIVLVGAHLDSFDLGTGANDNGVSCAELIDLARQIKASGLVPRRTIRFVLFTGEEQGMIGSRAYVAAHAAELDRHAAVVIYDIGSGRLTGMFLNGREDLRPAVNLALGRVGSLGPFVSPAEAIDGTDNFDFLLSGVPNLVGFQDPAPYLPDYHAESDTFDKVDAREAKAGEAALAALVWQLANSESRAPRQSRAEVEALIRETKLEEQMRAFGQWEDWIARRRGLDRSPAVKPPSAPQ